MKRPHSISKLTNINSPSRSICSTAGSPDLSLSTAVRSVCVESIGTVFNLVNHISGLQTGFGQ